MPAAKILIIRFSSIGDIVLTSPVVRCLKQQTGAQLHYLTKKRYQALLEANPHLSKVYTIEKNVNEVLPQLKREGYHGIIDLHKNLRSLHVRLVLQKPTYSFDKLNWKKWLLVNFKLDRMPELHIVDRYLATVVRLGVQNDGQGLDYFIPDDFKSEKVDAIIPHHAQSIVFAIGAAHKTKRLPLDKIISICQGTRKKVILLGGPAEADEGEKIATSCGPHVINACGKLNLHESALVIKKAEKVITHDTGMMHIAAAFGKKIVSIWGNTVPKLGMTPYLGNKGGQDTRFEVPELSCRPCSKIGFKACPKGHFKCMNEQDIPSIVKQLAGS